MAIGNEGSHLLDGLTVKGGIQVGDSGPFIAPGDNLDPFHGGWAPNAVEPLHRQLATGTVTSTSQLVRWTFFTAPFNFTVTNVVYAADSTAAGATPTLVRYGIYTVNAGGDVTLAQGTTNDTTLLASTNTESPKALTAPYALVAGNRYGVALLVVTAAAAPTIPGTTGSRTAISSVKPLFGATQSGQSDLPTSTAFASLTAVTTAAYCRLT